MRIQISGYPAKKHFEGSVDPKHTMRQIMEEQQIPIDEKTRVIVDKNQDFHRIPIDDQVNRYYDGKLGEMYRIMDGNCTRYRIVIPPIPQPKDKQKAKAKMVTGIMYANAYDTILTMLGHRKCDPDILASFSMPRAKICEHYNKGNIHSITIPDLRDDQILINHRGHAMYVVFVSPDSDVMTSRRYADLKHMLVNWAAEIAEHYNRTSGSHITPFGLEDIDADEPGGLLDEFCNKIEIIIVYNNEKSGTEMSPDLRHKPYQGFAVQALSFNVTRHIEQPSKYVLLDGEHDRAEIASMYSINGRTVDLDTPLSEYNFRDGVRFISV